MMLIYTSNMQFLTGGKVKDIYEIDHLPDCLLFRFSDRVSAYDVKFDQEIPRKGEVLCRFAEFWFEKLSSVHNHFVRRESATDIIVKKMKMLPIECVVRGYLYGSLYDRWKAGTMSIHEDNADLILASKLSTPIFDPTTKSEHDVPIDKKTAIATGLVSDKQYDWLERKSIFIYKTMATIADSAGFVLADLKLEFGVLTDGNDNNNCVLSDYDTDMIALGDSIGPDEYRLWPKDTFEPGRVQSSYDKQILRDWLSDQGYKKQFENDRNAGRIPVAPLIPVDVVSKMTRRYVDSFERIADAVI